MIEEYVRSSLNTPLSSELSLSVEELGTMDVIRFLRVMNRFVSLSSFVNMSAMLIFPSMCLIDTVLSVTDYIIAFSLIVICLRPFVVVDLDQHMHALLSLYT